MSSSNDKKDTEPSDDGDITLVINDDSIKGTLEEVGKAPPALVCLVGPPKYQGKRWAITKTRVLIGRALENDIVLQDASVSKSHAKINHDDGNVTITDLGSTNKTILNGRKLSPQVAFALQNNDQIKLGQLIFKFLEKGSLESVSLHKTWELRLRDPLTGIYNREALLLKAEEEFKRAKALTTELSVIFFDLDHFKQVNDTYGHPAGDYVLKEMARVTKQHAIRSEDFFARYGGEEFVVILSGSPIGKATEIAERIRKAIEQHAFIFEGRTLSITISAGISSKGQDTQSWEDLFKKADQALYKSKQDGRNRISAD